MQKKCTWGLTLQQEIPCGKRQETSIVWVAFEERADEPGDCAH